MTAPYQPIACALYDAFEAAATRADLIILRESRIVAHFRCNSPEHRLRIARVHDRGAIIFAQNPKVVILEGWNRHDGVGIHEGFP